MDNGSVAAGGKVGFALYDSNDARVFEFRFVGDDTHYSVFDGAFKTLNSAGKEVSFTRKGLRVTFELTSSTGYTLSIRKPNTNSSAINYFETLSSQMGTTIAKVRLFNNSAGSGDAANVYFNTMSIPEPTTFSVLSGGLLLAALKRKRR
jgi:hypothetical protein